MYPSYKKPGYSVQDAASILHATPATIRTWIDSKKLGALMSTEEVVPGKRRQIRILPEHIKEFMRRHRGKFDDAQLKTWGVLDEPAIKVETIEEKLNREISGEELMQDEALFEALCQKICVDAPKKEESAAEAEAKEPAIMVDKETPSSAVVFVDGRIAVGNITRKSAIGIVDILLSDPLCKFTTVSIEVK